MLTPSQEHLIKQVEENWVKMVECVCYVLKIQNIDHEGMKEQVINDIVNDWENMSESLKNYFGCRTDGELEQKILKITSRTTDLYYRHIKNSQNAMNN